MLFANCTAYIKTNYIDMLCTDWKVKQMPRMRYLNVFCLPMFRLKNLKILIRFLHGYSELNENTAVKTFSSYSEIDDTISELLKQQNNSGLDIVKSAAGDAATENVLTYAQTYKQAENVDEADIIKTDGKYIYHCNDTNGKIIITLADSTKTKTVSTINVSDNNDDMNIVDFFLKDNRLIANISSNVWNNKYINYTIVRTYDISDKSNPEMLNEYKQSGYYISSRMIEDTVYVVSNHNVNADDEKYYPSATDNKGKFSDISAEDICKADNPETPDYIVVGAINSLTGKNAAQTKAVLGASSDIYCNGRNLYVTSCYTNDIIKADDGASENSKSSVTQIFKAELSDGGIKFIAAGKVNGCINNQFSMDEKDGYLRVATTLNKNSKDTNNLYVLDKNLKEVGKIENFAKNEHIEAVRFLGDTAYVITYEQIDPLFIIDISNPAKPKITGSVEITGFSSLLVPVDEKTLLGIGSSTEVNGDSQMIDGIKIVLFDISNKNRPKILDSKVMKNCSSEAMYNHKALVFNNDKGYYAIPFDDYSKDYSSGAVTFEIKNNKIVIGNTFMTKNAQIKRCTYIGDYLYTIDMDDNVHSFEFK